MSRKDAFAFLRKSADDERLQNKLREGGKDAILPIAVEEGFSFSMQELNEVSREIKGDTEELSDDLLEIVVGGISLDDAASWFEKNLDKLRSVYDDINGKS